jgi:hypothetical protein
MADSIRDTLTAAFEKAAPAETELENAGLDSTPDSQVADDSPGETEDHDASASSSDDAETDGGLSAPSAEATPSAEPVVDVPPPASWSTQERADWAKVPKSARDAVARREGEMNRAFQASAEARRRVSTLDEMAKPYKPLLDSYGIRVEDAMPGLLATRAALEVGTAEQKALLVANLCADFGLDINLLDGALSQRYANGQPAPRYEAPPQMNLQSNPELAPLFAIANELKERRQAQAVTMVNEVRSQPHYEAVRLTMADLIDQAKLHGRDLPLPRAYELATQLHGLAAAPQSGPVSASQAASILARSRNAASSVAGAPKPSLPRKAGEGTARDEIEALMARRK